MSDKVLDRRVFFEGPSLCGVVGQLEGFRKSELCKNGTQAACLNRLH